MEELDALLIEKDILIKRLKSQILLFKQQAGNAKKQCKRAEQGKQEQIKKNNKLKAQLKRERYGNE